MAGQFVKLVCNPRRSPTVGLIRFRDRTGPAGHPDPVGTPIPRLPESPPGPPNGDPCPRTPTRGPDSPATPLGPPQTYVLEGPRDQGLNNGVTAEDAAEAILGCVDLHVGINAQHMGQPRHVVPMPMRQNDEI